MFLLRRSGVASQALVSSTTGCCGTHQRAMSHKLEAASKVAHLEVESKFHVTALLKLQLDGEPASPQQLSSSPATDISLLRFTRQPDKLINDQYFDLDNTLCSKGIWVRRRAERTLLSHDSPFQIRNQPSIEWEAKVRVGGDYQSSQFEELVGEKMVMDLVNQHVPDVERLCKVVDIDTFRRAWTVREHVERAVMDQGQRMTMVIDSSTTGASVVRMPEDESAFRHLVGEVEFTMDLKLGEDEAKNAGAKREMSKLMETELDMFMERHSSLFPTRPAPIGKLSAYCAWKKQQKEHPR